MVCPICHTEMEFLPNSNRWVCRRALQNEVEYYIDAETMETSITRLGSVACTAGVETTSASTVLTPPEQLPMTWFEIPPNWPPIVTPAEAAEVRKLTLREKTKEWFNPMPKSLKLMLLRLDPQIENVMHHYEDWDVKALQYHEFMGSTQRALQKAYEEKHPE